MFSDVIKSALESAVVGQHHAINSMVRGVTRVASGLTPRERSYCAYLFMGPTGTGKTHLVQSLARVLHGDERRVVVADCTQFVQGDPWMVFVSQLQPLFSPQGVDTRAPVVEAPPLSILRIEYLERGPREVAKALAVALETGQIMLAQGRRGSLNNCLIFITSTLCAREILDEAPRIGFSGTQEDEEEEAEHDRLFKTCRDQAEQNFGNDLIGRLDALVMFHRLQEEHLSEILDRRVQRLNQWLIGRGFRCVMLTDAKSFLLERGRRDMRMGARDLIRAHQRLVEFPLADLMISGRIPNGAVVQIDRRQGEDHLHFSVTEAEAAPPDYPVSPTIREIPVAWDEPGYVH